MTLAGYNVSSDGDGSWEEQDTVVNIMRHPAHHVEVDIDDAQERTVQHGETDRETQPTKLLLFLHVSYLAQVVVSL